MFKKWYLTFTLALCFILGLIYLNIFHFRLFSNFLSDEQLKSHLTTERLVLENYNKEKIQLYMKFIFPFQSDEIRIDRLLLLAEQDLISGNAQGANEKIDKSLNLYKSNNLKDQHIYQYIQEAKLVTTLRMGETRNCSLKLSNKSCIYPVKLEAIYQNKEFTEKAFNISNKLIEEFPDVVAYKWINSLIKNLLNIDSKNLLTKSIKYKLTPFEDLSSDLGINVFSNAGSGVVDDFNNDGKIDLIISSTRSSLIYYEGTGDYFVNKTLANEIDQFHSGFYADSIDYNNDGCLDVLLLKGAWQYEDGRDGHTLLKGDCTGHFRNVSKETGLRIFEPTQVVAKADFNNDGFVDLFIGCESNEYFECHPHLLLNELGHRFKDITDQTHLKAQGYLKGAVATDFNNDGKMDLVISDLTGELKFFVNQFEENQLKFKSIDAGIKISKSFSIMSLDFNNDGLIDLAVARSIHPYEKNLKDIKSRFNIGNLLFKKYLYMNADGIFNKNFLNKTARSFFNLEASREYGFSILLNRGNSKFKELDLAISKEAIPIMGSGFGDINNDGFLDIYLGTGSMEFSALLPNRFLINDSGKDLIDVTANLELGHLQKGHSVIFHDFNNDGSEDIFINSGGAYESDKFYKQLYVNKNRQGNFIKLKLRGKKSNYFGVGTKIKLKLGSRFIFREFGAHSSFGGVSNQLQIGIGNAKKIDSLEVFWPTSNSTSIYKNILPNKSYLVEEFNSNLLGL